MRLISFDVFDTVLTRTWAEPRDFFGRIGERLTALVPAVPVPPSFAAVRRCAEQDARRRMAGGEVRLTDIYAELAAQLHWNDAQQTAALAVEITVETEAIRPVTVMRAEVDRARREAGRVIFISDMYLPSTVIQPWLEQAGFWHSGDLLYISGEAGVGKGSGKLFEKIRHELGGNFAGWIHHGDHPNSDQATPVRLGMTARPQTAARLNARERQLRGAAPVAPGWRSLLAGAGRLARLDQPAATTNDPIQRVRWETGAEVAGPLFYGFAEWCLAEAELRGLRDLFFLARGGQIFFRLAREIQAVRPRKLCLHYLPVSRLALVGAADLDHPARLRALAAPQLGFHSARQACANLGLALDEPLTPPWLPAAEWKRNLTESERTALADWLLDPVRLPRVQAALRERQLRARGYLRQQGLAATADCGLVDTGWMGTIQHHLEKALGTEDAPAPLTGFYLGLSPQRAPACTGPMLAYANTLSQGPSQRVQTPRVLAELMTRADHGPVTGYKDEGQGALTPQLGPWADTEAAQACFFQEAVLAFTRHALAAGSELAATRPGELAQVAEDVWTAFYDRPTPAEALAFGRLPHSDQLLEQNYALLCPPMRPGEVLAAMFNRQQRPVCWWLEGQAALGSAPLLQFYLALKKMKWWLQAALSGGRPESFRASPR